MGPTAYFAAYERARDGFRTPYPPQPPKFASISNLKGLDKINSAYERMVKKVLDLTNPLLKEAMKFFSKEIVTGMEEFIISKASPKALEGEGSKELPFNDRYPNLRAPSFQTCIAAMDPFQQESSIEPHVCLKEIQAIVDEFKKHANKIEAPPTTPLLSSTQAPKSPEPLNLSQ